MEAKIKKIRDMSAAWKHTHSFKKNPDHFFLAADFVAATAFFCAPALAEAACFWPDFLLTDFGDLSPMMVGSFTAVDLPAA